MRIVENLITWIKGNQELPLVGNPNGTCPNCWGRVEYGGAFYKAIKNEGIDVNQPKNHLGWIQDYADKHLSQITLVSKDNEYVCQLCKVKYQKAS